MTVQNDRAAIQIAALDLQKVNDAFRRVSQQITLLEGRSGTVGVRDSMTITSDKQTLVDFDSSTAGKGSIVAFGTENATLALAKGSRKEDNGEWIATDTSSTIFALDRSGNGTLYYNSGLTVGQAFTPTSIYIIGSGGSVASHALTGGSSPHTESGLTPGYILTALTASTFGWAAAPATGVPTTRNINTTLPLTGGGDLSADRTLSINEATIGTVGASGLEGTIVPPAVGDSGERYALVNNDGGGTPDMWAYVTEGLGIVSGSLKLRYPSLSAGTPVPASDQLAYYDVTNSVHEKATIDAVMATVDAATLGAGASTDGQVLTSDGAGGTAWEDAAAGTGGGSYLINSNTTPVGNVGGGTDDLITYTLPGGTLSDNGDALLVTCAGTLAANTNAKTGIIYFGSSTSTLVSTSSSGVTHWKMQMLIVRLSATTQRIHAWGGVNGTDLYNQYIDGAETLANNITIKATGAATSNDDIIQKFMTVEYLPIGGGAAPSQVDTQTFTTPGADTWTKPTSFTPKRVWVRMWGAGGAGGGGGAALNGTKRYGGGAAGGGAYNEAMFSASDLGVTEAVTVGTGGTGGSGGSAGTGGNGTAGSGSSFGNPVRLYAGGGGGGPGGGTGGGSTYCGGGGGGHSADGTTGVAGTYGLGGNTNIPTGTYQGYPSSGGAGANAVASGGTSGSYAERGGGGGGTANNAANPVST